MAAARFALAAGALLALGASGTPRAQPAAPVAYVTNEADGTLSVVDLRGNAVVRTLALGKRPRGLVLSPDGERLYVALSGSPVAGPGVDEATLPPPDRAADGIGVVDLHRHRVERVIRGVTDPEQLALSPDGRRLYVASEDAGSLAVFDLRSGRVLRRLAVGREPEGVGVSADGRRICATSEGDATVALIDARSLAVEHRVPVGQRPRSCVFSRDGRRLFVPGEADASLSVVDVPTGRRVRTIALAGEGVRPMGVALSPDGATAYVSTGRAARVLAVDLAQGRVAGNAQVGTRPWGLAMTPDGGVVVTADGPSDTLSIVRTGRLRRVAQVAVGHKPWGVVIGRGRP